MRDQEATGRFESIFKRFREPDGSVLGPFVFPEMGFPDPTNEANDAEIAYLLNAVTECGGTFRMLCLGASPGEWAIRAERAFRKRFPSGDYASVNVDADLCHIQMIQDFLTRHECSLSRNAIIFGAVTPQDGWATFPLIEQNNWGASVSGFSKTITESTAGYRTVQAFSVPTLLEMVGNKVDFLHCDVQGEEGVIFTNCVAALSAKVKRCCISIHSTKISASLRRIFAEWIIEDAIPGTFIDGPNGEECHKDEVIVFLNPNAARRLKMPNSAISAMAVSQNT